MRSGTFAALLTAPLLASAHFSISSPPGRSTNSVSSQGTSPCAGLPPSRERTPFPLNGRGQVKFEAGHDEAKTQVNIAIGKEDPQIDDFDTTLVDTFLQIGFGDFCWNELPVDDDDRDDLRGIKNGTVATIQIIQNAIDGMLYNCADVILVDNYEPPQPCSNATGIGAVEAQDDDIEDDENDNDNDDDDDDDRRPTNTNTGNNPAQTDDGSGAGSNAVIGGVLGFAVAAAGLFLGL